MILRLQFFHLSEGFNNCVLDWLNCIALPFNALVHINNSRIYTDEKLDD